MLPFSSCRSLSWQTDLGSPVLPGSAKSRWGGGVAFSLLSCLLKPQDMTSLGRGQSRLVAARRLQQVSKRAQTSRATKAGFARHPSPADWFYNLPRTRSSLALTAAFGLALAEEKPHHGTHSAIFISQPRTKAFILQTQTESPLQPGLARRSLSLQSGGEGALNTI